MHPSDLWITLERRDHLWQWTLCHDNGTLEAQIVATGHGLRVFDAVSAAELAFERACNPPTLVTLETS